MCIEHLHIGGGKELNTQWKQKNIDLEESEPSNINQDKIDQKRRGEFGGRQVGILS